jgi:nucleoside-diphosphate-sugar epimerase
MRILITGGAGFIGVRTAYRFAAEHDVTVVDDCRGRGRRRICIGCGSSANSRLSAATFAGPMRCCSR